MRVLRSVGDRGVLRGTGGWGRRSGRLRETRGGGRLRDSNRLRGGCGGLRVRRTRGLRGISGRRVLRRRSGTRRLDVLGRLRRLGGGDGVKGALSGARRVGGLRSRNLRNLRSGRRRRLTRRRGRLSRDGGERLGSGRRGLRRRDVIAETLSKRDRADVRRRGAKKERARQNNVQFFHFSLRLVDWRSLELARR